MKHIILILVVFLFVGCGQKATSDADSLTQESVTRHQSDFPYDSIKGCWGTDSETGNSILYIGDNDSLFWVDPSLWCTYYIENDTITILSDTFVYCRGRVEYRNDTLFFSDSDYSWEYERYKN